MTTYMQAADLGLGHPQQMHLKKARLPNCVMLQTQFYNDFPAHNYKKPIVQILNDYKYI